MLEKRFCVLSTDAVKSSVSDNERNTPFSVEIVAVNVIDSARDLGMVR